MKTYESTPGSEVTQCSLKAIEMADNANEPVQMVFNDTTLVFQPETAREGKSKEDYASEMVAFFFSETDRRHREYLASDKYKDDCRKRREDEERKRIERAELTEAVKTMDEAQLREAKAPWPETMEELQTFINALAERNHDYGTSVYAMSLAAVATFNYMAYKLGSTGFQAGCADMDIIRQIRGWERFIILNGADLAYPQSDPSVKFSEWRDKTMPWVADECRKKIAETEGHVHPDVMAHWQRIAARYPASEDKEGTK